MSDLPAWITDIAGEANAKPVVLVEGQDDVDSLDYFLSLYVADWEQRLYLASAEGKKRVIKGISVHCPDWVGIIDRDEWSPADIQDALDRTERLRILPRFCIESYFCVPGELWAALPPMDRQRVNDDVSQLSEPILAALPDWVAHGAMWRVLRVRAAGVRSRDVFPHALQESPITDEDEIRRVLETWQGYLDPESILHEYRAERKRGLALPVDEQLTRYVVGDKFFVQVVTPALDELFGASNKNWLERLRDGQIQPPPDLAAFFNEILGLIKRPPHNGGKT